MLALPAMAVTTRHSASAFPWHFQRGFPQVGSVIGIDLASGGTMCFDPFELYRLRVITSPNMAILGMVGAGKSALVKSYLFRQALWGYRLLVVDPKGEYGPLADAVGLARISLAPGGRTRINPLDTQGLSDKVGDRAKRRAELVAALAETGLGRSASPEERAAICAVTGRCRPGATLVDVVEGLLEPSAEVAAELATTPLALAGAVRPAALELRRLLAGDLAGMFDGPTNLNVDWSGPGVVLDLSAVFGSAALAPVMVCAMSWLGETVAAGGRRSILVLDEAWAVLRLVGVTRWLQQAAKLSRSFGLSVVVVTHRISDLTAQADDGSEAAKQARGLLADTQVRVIYQQAAAEAASCGPQLGLSDVECDLVATLPPYRALWRVGDGVAVVNHLLSAMERRICETDNAMIGTERR
jgi:type IV secretory pathway VirB4 component